MIFLQKKTMETVTSNFCRNDTIPSGWILNKSCQQRWPPQFDGPIPNKPTGEAVTGGLVATSEGAAYNFKYQLQIRFFKNYSSNGVMSRVLLPPILGEVVHRNT